MLADDLDILREALTRLDLGFEALPAFDTTDANRADVREVLLEVADRLQNNYPYFHPLYAGQMLKPPHPVARLAYALAMWINPNNHALDGSRASSPMEKEAVAEIARMFGWETHLGHLCGGGTMANLEALWIAGELHPGKTVLASDQAHYTHRRVCDVLKIPFDAVPTDRNARMDTNALEQRLQKGGVGAVVATIGTTAVGSVDPLKDILELQREYGYHIHADAAYGGYFGLIETLTSVTRQSYDLLGQVDSIAIDPHKHGLQPYGCGCILFRDPSMGRYYLHNSPYTYFTSGDLHMGEISLECSRAGAAAVALWATQRLLPLVRGGEFAKMLEAGREAALDLYGRLKADERFITALPPELDIVVWAVRAESISEASKQASQVFDEAAKRGLHLALAELPLKLFALLNGMVRDRETITCLRSVLMKPEHKEWVGRIWDIMDQATNECGVWLQHDN